MANVITRRAPDPILDELTQAPRAVDEIRHLLHNGKVFVATQTHTGVANSTFDMLVRTGPTTETVPHILDLLALCEKKGCLFQLYIGPTIGDIGIDEGSFNLNFQSNREAATQVWIQPEVLSVGGLLTEFPLPDQYVAAVSPEMHSVLLPNTDFLFRVNIASAMTIRVIFRWYEQQNAEQTLTQK